MTLLTKKHMEQPNEQPIEPVQSSKNIWITATAVIITVLIVGGGIYAWQRSNLKNTEQNLKQQISVLQNQISQLKQQLNKPSNTQTLTGFKLINDKCYREECLFTINNEHPLGMATIQGYYTQVDDTRA